MQPNRPFVGRRPLDETATVNVRLRRLRQAYCAQERQAAVALLRLA